MTPDPVATLVDHWARFPVHGHPMGCFCKGCTTTYPCDAEGNVIDDANLPPATPDHQSPLQADGDDVRCHKCPFRGTGDEWLTHDCRIERLKHRVAELESAMRCEVEF